MDITFEVTIHITDDSFDGPDPNESDVERAVEAKCRELGVPMEVDAERQ